ncbi:DUF1837 domain-containing protein [Pediococcus acidilactici]|uniref:HamA C-terminal domain-containing protein n=1 Tax=Pediococcus acidilactici TaxID=1254 RepID=UPI00132132CE|nr:DUF1837 domain-containing protein [Pediococcus acidilactici]KAF0385109.1 DUF1837 domain-containing protein [Pediococcus acidilactici]KAF0430226.1 DUF1837 domain-containing protein [Pediococcus acidilactici]KAF0439285.1 DUF1837 domain-containing protein [Pediococcus acidilactici]
MANNEFRILIDSLRIAMNEDDGHSIEGSINIVLGKYTNNWKENTYSPQNLKKLYYKGLNYSAAKKIKGAVINEESFRKYIDNFSFSDKESMAAQLQTVNKDATQLEANAVPYFCVNLLNELIEETITGQQKKPTKSGPNGYLKKTVSDDSFSSVFTEVATKELPLIKNSNAIHAFILKPDFFPFSYKNLEDLILKNITSYAAARGIEKNDVAGIKATRILRDYMHSGVPQNLLGEMLTYIFLEHIDGAKKIYTRAEISANSRTINSEGIYLKDNKGKSQLILGASQLNDNLQDAIKNVVSELKEFRNNRSQSLVMPIDLIDSSILREQYSEEESKAILKILVPTENKIDEVAAYGLFIGYKFASDDNLKNCSTDEAKLKCRKIVENDLHQVIAQLDDEIRLNEWQRSSFYVYMLPLISASTDGNTIMSELIG